MTPEHPQSPIESSDAPAPYSPPPATEKPGHGCFFYGCITAIVLSVILVIVVAGGGYMAYRTVMNMAMQYTETSPTKFAKVEMSPEEVKSLEERVKAFSEALKKGEETEPLVFTSDQLNALIADQPELKDKAQATIEGDEIKGRISYPLDQFGIPGLTGRYLNGMAGFNVSLEHGALIVTIRELEVKGKPVPPDFLKGLSQQNLAKDVYKDPKNAEMIGKLDSIVVKDGKIIVKARSKESRSASPEPEPAAPKTSDETKGAVPPPAADPKDGASNKGESDAVPKPAPDPKDEAPKKEELEAAPKP